jgi:hypothetical protein
MEEQEGGGEAGGGEKGGKGEVRGAGGEDEEGEDD